MQISVLRMHINKEESKVDQLNSQQNDKINTFT